MIRETTGEISPGELRRSDTSNPIRVDLSSTRHLGQRRHVRRSGEMIWDTFLPRIFFGKTETLSPIVGALSKMLVEKSGLGFLNPVTSAQEKYLSSQDGDITGTGRDGRRGILQCQPPMESK